jgi:tetratricopeptide (TPR) repeat protein
VPQLIGSGTLPDSAELVVQADVPATFAAVYCRRCLANYEKGDVKKAEADFAATEAFDERAAYKARGEFWLTRSKYRQAIADFSQLLRSGFQDVEVYIKRGQAQARSGELDNAIADFSEAVRLEPRNAIAFAMRGASFQRQGRHVEALADFSELLRLEPKNLQGYFSRALLNREKGAFREALADLEAAVAIEAHNPVACTNLALFLATCQDGALRDGKRSIDLATRACELTDWKAWNCVGVLGMAYAETGDFDEAAKWQMKALETCPESAKSAGVLRLQMYKASEAYRE